MSSTNRSNARDSHIADYYVTPIAEIHKFLVELDNLYNYLLCTGKILDPCAGGDAVNPMSYPEALKLFNKYKRIDTIDIREDSRAAIKADYLTTDCKNKYDIIMTNPPFNMALDIILKAMEDVRANGLVVMLLRLNFFGSKDRKPFWEKHMPQFCFVHHKRMSFTDEKGTDSIEYCHMVWKKDINPEYTKLKVI
jgi:hypothetical protein